MKLFVSKIRRTGLRRTAIICTYPAMIALHILVVIVVAAKRQIAIPLLAILELIGGEVSLFQSAVTQWRHIEH